MTTQAKFVPPTDEDVIAAAKLTNPEVDWSTTDHDKVTERDALVAKTRDFLTTLRACITANVPVPQPEPEKAKHDKKENGNGHHKKEREKEHA